MKKILGISFFALFFYTACTWHNGRRIKGNGHVVTETKPISEIHGVELHASFDVYLSEGSASGVRIEAEENVIPHIELRVQNGILNIEVARNVSLRRLKSVKIYVTAPAFSRIQNTASGTISSQTRLSHDEKVEIRSSGSGDTKLDVDAPDVEARVSGSGTVSITGEAKKVNASVSGSGDLKALGLLAEESELRTTASGSIDAYASVKLIAKISGSGDIRYKGDAQVTTHDSGSGDVKKVD